MGRVSSGVRGQQDRRSEVVRAAIKAFARGGFGGTTLADIAKEAEVSQPRISQIFGTKEKAFTEAYQTATDIIVSELRVKAQPPVDLDRLTAAYSVLMEKDRDVILLVFQGFGSAYVPAIAEAAREALNRVIDVVINEAGASYEDARRLLERGFTIHHLLASDLLEHVDDSPHFAALLKTLNI